MAKHPMITKEHFTPDEFAELLDHSLLKTYITQKDLEIFCDDLKEYHIKYCSVNSYWVPDAVKLLKGTGYQVGVAVAFPTGKFLTEMKCAELELSLKQGAAFFDAVIDVGAIREKNYEKALRDMEAMVKVGLKYNAPGKAIIETCYLTDEEIVQAALCAREAGMDYVKTSSGFAIGPTKNGVNTLTNEHEIRLLKDTVGDDVGVKASSGVYTYETALSFIHAGAQRIGTASAPELIRQCAAYKPR